MGSSTTQYLLDDQGQEWGEYDGSGNLQRRLLHDPHDVAPVVLLDPASNPTWQHFDRQGSVVANTSGGAWAYLPFGDQPGNAVLAGTSFGYAGYRFDSETQTYHTQTRQYDPVLGRFLQTDPIGQASNRNIYAYVDNTPFSGTDPSGTDSGGPFGPGCDGCGPEQGTQGTLGVGYSDLGGGACGCEGNAQHDAMQASMNETVAVAGDSPVKMYDRGEITLGQTLALYGYNVSSLPQDYQSLVQQIAAFPGYYAPAPTTPVVPTGPLAILTDAAEDAADLVPDFVPQPLYGTLVHLQFAAIVRTLGPDYTAEQAYLDHIPVYGFPRGIS